ncbi:stage II sporulation protein E [Leptospira perolatii]|uniref:Stage II sporulation protein E n=1 Tax=Leptospira perolatii TaxID=2023191 RepID=A0A2M9ZNK1_9LEPT|nr:SpoIIE family protein phosphatase [Leptospira perolatii]PJZ69608.1 stage II sporulation protein E [Leptospira perolatii]PJZ73595.1 stage II sporulation protein E [Leptospira perolatii]
MDLLTLNFYSFGSILTALFYLYAMSFFLTIKDRSMAALHLGLCAVSSFLLAAGYFWGFSSPNESTVFHRYLVVISPLTSFGQLVAFFLYFPYRRGVKFGLPLYIALQVGAVGVLAYYVIISLSAPKVYVAGSHYWDFEVHTFYRYFSFIILFYDLCYLIVGIWRSIVEKGKERRSVIYILLAYVVITVVPGVLNALSRNGSVERATYQQAYNLGMVIGMFLIILVYVNATKERTTILNRIIGVTLATFLVCYQLAGYAILNSYERSYDEIKKRDAEVVVMDNRTASGLAYVQSFDPQTDSFALEKGKKDARFQNEDEIELKFFKVRKTLCNLGTLSAAERLQKSEQILENSPNQFYAYKAGILAFIKSKENQQITDQDLEDYFAAIFKELYVVRNKFSHLPNTADQASVLKLLKSDKVGLKETLSELEKRLSTFWKEANREKIRKIFLITLSPIYEEGQRIYRGTRIIDPGDPKPVFYVSYFFTHLNNGKFYEVGFDYHDYRMYQHTPANIMVLSLLAMFVVVAFGFRFFFQNALVNPMSEVLTGLTEVNSGNLEYRLVPRVEDEIGFIARSFNKMARSIQAARKKLQQYAESLEEKVKERTRELEQTLGEVRELKQQQDGDYFLTSLLIKPLGSNKANGENVNVDFLLEQKKKFTFRNYKDEIGGDLNIANHIQLRGNSYTVFLNADAMGKSMQGAGGALVLGAVFESIIERTKIVESISEQSPERWLKNAFTELHKVFESFDGSMLVSLVMGLVDDQVGILYYINAEHPWTVLYRDGVASFIENDLMFRKLGTTGMEGSIFIKTFQLAPGDVIIAGSDGRDDILLGTSDSGSRIINDNESFFLKRVQEGNGDLKSIYDSICDSGDLTDDLSLIRIAFKETDSEQRRIKLELKEKIKELLQRAKETAQNKEIEEAIAFLQQAESLDSNIPEVKKNFVRLFLNQKEYSKAAKYAEDYLNMKPVDKEILYVASFAARKAGQLEKALDFGERLRLREPEHLKNLVNLAQTYLALKDYKKATIMAQAATKLDPNHEVLTKVQQVIEKYLEKIGEK